VRNARRGFHVISYINRWLRRPRTAHHLQPRSQQFAPRRGAGWPIRKEKMTTLQGEWLVADQQGGFAMGTPGGYRLRKYHGLYLGVASRSETAYLLDLEIECNGAKLWPHCFASSQGSVIAPDLSKIPAVQFTQNPGPQWTWDLTLGRLTFSVEAGASGGISLKWTWSSAQAGQAELKIRPFVGLRSIHATGGLPWEWETLGSADRARILNPEGDALQFLLEGGLQWRSDPIWYRDFRYPEEATRGYDCQEDLFSAGELSVVLRKGSSCGLVMSEKSECLDRYQNTPRQRRVAKKRSPILDFVLNDPAGVVAGYPWFGEWGRDTFVSLPGIVSAMLRHSDSPEDVWRWTHEVLSRWGELIPKFGMLPNLIDKEQTHQWESADATLWWCHSLASLWQMSLGSAPILDRVREFSDQLDQAIHSIRTGKHLFLEEAPSGLLNVTQPHTTWMDARVNGSAVTPRTGFLPEINALWFQALCLQALWSEGDKETRSDDFEKLTTLARDVLQCREPDRPNSVFLHSLPLAPSFFIKDQDLLRSELAHLSELFWTPVGLRTLSPRHPDYQPHCVGTQEQRDRAYHQGPVWGWLGGHFEMARARLKTNSEEALSQSRMLTPEILKAVPIEGHVPELFDAEPPFTARGAPAQAWSLACLEESASRKRYRLDSKLTQVLGRRWLGRTERKNRKRSPEIEL
jgi:glycogen debranching enzyme